MLVISTFDLLYGLWTIPFLTFLRRIGNLTKVNTARSMSILVASDDLSSISYSKAYYLSQGITRWENTVILMIFYMSVHVRREHVRQCINIAFMLISDEKPPVTSKRKFSLLYLTNYLILH